MIGIIDYGMGNVKSVLNAFHYLGYEAELTNDKDRLYRADKIILPGVGAFRDAITSIRESKLDQVIYDVIEQKKPFLGICLGLQLLFEKSSENGEYEGLGILPGAISRFTGDIKIPHIGWNDLQIVKKSPLFNEIEGDLFVYFVHSYYVETEQDVVSATCYYGREFHAAVERDNVYACQFHPEKSGDAGLAILNNFGGMKDANLSGD